MSTRKLAFAATALTVALTAAPTLALARDGSPHRHSANALATDACRGADVTPSARNLPLVQAATLCLLNQERHAYHLRPLRSNRRLRHAAQGYSGSMAHYHFFAHTSAVNGRTFVQRIAGSRYLHGARSYTVGENIAWGEGQLSTPRQIVDAWMHSPPHRANILDRSFRDIGVGIAPGAPVTGGGPGATYTTDFGARG